MTRFLTILYIYFSIFIIIQCQNECIKFKKKLSNSSEIINAKNITERYGVNVQTFVRQIGSELRYGRIVYINNPKETLTVLQPNNDEKGCLNKMTYRTSYTASAAGDCEVATNAGLFKTATKECLGNLISNGKIYLNSNGIKNAHFGIKKNGNIFFGYLSEDEVLSNEFETLVGGVIWLLRNGKSVVNDSIAEECTKTQETGSLNYFAGVESARTAIGATADGTVALVHVEGKTSQGGINLYDLSNLLLELGLVAAINLDGGGSATMLINGTLIGYPSDGCRVFTCERPVSTVLCVRHPRPGLHLKMRSASPTVAVVVASLAGFGLVVVVFLVLGLRLWDNRRQSGARQRSTKLELFDDEECVHFDTQPLVVSGPDDQLIFNPNFHFCPPIVIGCRSDQCACISQK